MIKMIAGVFGLPVKDKDGKTVSVKGMDKDSEPFEAGAEQEARLVKLCMAVYVDGGSTKLPDGVEGVPDYDENTTAKELREIGKGLGLTFKVGMTKAEMIAAMDAHIEAGTVEPDEPEDSKDDDEDGVPTFDASEAVE